MNFARFAVAGALALAVSCAALAASAHGFKVGSLQIGHPWSRATPAGAKVGGGYLSIENKGTAPDRLVAVSVPFAARAEIHEMAVKDGIMTMRPLDNGIEIAPGQKVEFKPGGYHIMFMELKAPLAKEAKVPVTLVFEKAGSIDVDFNVEAMGAAGTGHQMR